MTNERCEGEKVAQLEANFGEAIDKQDWIQCVNNQVHFLLSCKDKMKLMPIWSIQV